MLPDQPAVKDTQSTHSWSTRERERRSISIRSQDFVVTSPGGPLRSAPRATLHQEAKMRRDKTASCLYECSSLPSTLCTFARIKHRLPFPYHAGECLVLRPLSSYCKRKAGGRQIGPARVWSLVLLPRPPLIINYSGCLHRPRDTRAPRGGQAGMGGKGEKLKVGVGMVGQESGCKRVSQFSLIP